MPSLCVLSAGAAKGIVQALAGAFEAESGTRVDATFDSAGAIRNAFVENGRADVVILPAGMLDALAAQRRLDVRSIAALGCVPTGIAVPAGEPLPEVGHVDALRASLADAPALYCPDTVRSTAGLHFVEVLRTLGIGTAKVRSFPNGARAMAALAADGVKGAIGCTQVTEILYTPGVVLVAPLPAPFALATVYSIAVSADSMASAPARAFAALLTGDAAIGLRRSAGFLAAT